MRKSFSRVLNAGQVTDKLKSINQRFTRKFEETGIWKSEKYVIIQTAMGEKRSEIMQNHTYHTKSICVSGEKRYRRTNKTELSKKLSNLKRIWKK